MRLIELNLYQVAKISCINCNKTLKSRLAVLGITEGAKITYYQNSPLGSPKIYRVRGVLIAVDNEVAKNILVEII